MLRGFYTAASGILSQQRTLDVLTNNIANVRTPGFRASRVVTSSFEQELLTRMEGSNSAVIGSSAPMQVVSEVPVKFDTNSLQETGSPFDFALDGEGFFNIQAPEDEAGNPGAQYLTRNGSFTLNGDKQLELTGVGLVLGEKGVIELDDANFTVDTDGSVYDSRGRYVDRLLVTVPAEGAQTRIAGNGLYVLQYRCQPGICHGNGSPACLPGLQQCPADHRPDRPEVRIGNRVAVRKGLN